MLGASPRGPPGGTLARSPGNGYAPRIAQRHPGGPVAPGAGHSTPPCGGTTVAATRGKRAGSWPRERSRRRSSGRGVRRNGIPPLTDGSGHVGGTVSHISTTPTRYSSALDGLCTEPPRALRAHSPRNHADFRRRITVPPKSQVDSSACGPGLTGCAPAGRPSPSPWVELEPHRGLSLSKPHNPDGVSTVG